MSLRIGILADGHGRIDALADGIETLKGRKVDRLIHLGDIIDALRPETIDECARLLIENSIDGVLGNHEYSFVTHHLKRYPERFSESGMEYLRALPYVLEIPEISEACFTHFSPEGGVHGLYAATDEAGYRATLLGSSRRILVNGHSHDPRAFRRLDGVFESFEFDLSAPFKLRPDARYILTCGALEDGWCAIFDADARSFEIVSLER